LLTAFLLAFLIANGLHQPPAWASSSLDEEAARMLEELQDEALPEGSEAAAAQEGAGAEPGLPREAMAPIGSPTSKALALKLYPDNAELVNPFGRHRSLSCEGLMQWLAPRSRGRWHSGIDLVPARGRARGAKLYAPGDGYVLRRRDWHPAWGSYLVAVFRKGDDLYMMGFFHLRARSHNHLVERSATKGVTGLITKGQYLGRVGRTGAARGAHLHLDVVHLRNIVAPAELPPVLWTGREWSEFVHPADVIDGLPRAVYRGRARPSQGLIVRRPRRKKASRPS
jgi:murein DD-endopeptidase MepM/ murein hydrolase activator NlpD